MPEAQRQRLLALVEAGDFFALPEALRKERPRPQDFLYALTVDRDGLSRTVTLHLDVAPPAIRTLIAELESLQDGSAS